MLRHKIPIPLMEKGHCAGVWNPLESTWYDAGGDDYVTNRDCSSYDPVDYVQPLSTSSSRVIDYNKEWEAFNKFEA